MQEHLIMLTLPSSVPAMKSALRLDTIECEVQTKLNVASGISDNEIESAQVNWGISMTPEWD